MSARNHRLPRHLTWPLRPRDVRIALGIGPEADLDLSFDDRPWRDGTLLHAEWLPPRPSNYGTGTDPASWNGLRFRIAPTTTAVSHENGLRVVLIHHAIPQLGAWATAALSAPEGWTLSAHSRSWRFTEKHVQYRDDLRPYPELPVQAVRR
ncbi:hypothetical protein ACIA8O_14945 [Kitasatospora sp. NPDC051853]|uniref:hypothetical protein n=1 Tax=Kitasatospora sp. NPDC051853 TaxID=3364058 RepID=UPI0037BB0003